MAVCSQVHLCGVWRASYREQLLESVTDTDRTPWSFTRVAEEIGGNQYEDTSSDKPTLEEWNRAQDPVEAPQPARLRLRRKRPEPFVELDEDAEMIPDEVYEPATSSRRRDNQAKPSMFAGLQKGSHWWEEVRFGEEQAFWTQESACVEIDVPLPESRKGLQNALQDLPCYLVTTLRRRGVEVHERHITDAERQEFAAAKAVEVRNFIASEAFQVYRIYVLTAHKQLACAGF